MTFTFEEVEEMWKTFRDNIIDFTDGDRQVKLLEFYDSRENEIASMPASSNVAHHSAFPSGYIYHVNRVVDACHYMYKIWDKFGGCEGFTIEELIFSAINHDLGKIGDLENELYLESKDKWRIGKGMPYEHNPAIEFMTIPDRSLFLLQELGVTLTRNEWIAIKTHDGLYDEANKAYLFSYVPESKMRNNMAYILHQADMLAARTEFMEQWVKDFDTQSVPEPVEVQVNKGIKTKLNKA